MNAVAAAAAAVVYAYVHTYISAEWMNAITDISRNDRERRRDPCTAVKGTPPPRRTYVGVRVRRRGVELCVPPNYHVCNPILSTVTTAVEPFTVCEHDDFGPTTTVGNSCRYIYIYMLHDSVRLDLFLKIFSLSLSSRR